ncbi:MAG: LamG domain-containing protein [Planctomycetota bacterium]|jgi:hypothetical protein
MRKAIFSLALLCINIVAVGNSYAAEEGELAAFSFEQLVEKVIRVQLDADDKEEYAEQLVTTVVNEVSGEPGVIHGNFMKLAEGINSKKAIRYDGYTTYIVIDAKNSPKISGAFSVEAWIALGAYPKSWTPIINQCNEEDCGYSLEISSLGKLCFKVGAGGRLQELVSKENIERNKWTYVAGVYSPEDGMNIYINGTSSVSKKIKGEFKSVSDMEVLIGRTRVMSKPDGTIRPNATAAVHEYLDMLLDELKVSQGAIEGENISKAYKAAEVPAEPSLPARVLPIGPKDLKEFGAYDMTLSYYDAWDAAWRVTDYSDIVIAFDDNPCRFVFWRGMSYIPHWVTENGIWYDNEFNETWSEKGCHEPMSDKDCRHSRIRVIENNDARVVVKWRYALVDNWYQFANVSELTNRGDWTDEIYTIYPDMTGVRMVSLMSEHPESPHEWHESIIVMSPERRPDEVLEFGALTLVNPDGETKTYSWEHETPPEEPQEPANSNIQIINTDSQFKPFACFRPQDNPWPDVYVGEIRRDVCVFPWWNHWPVAPRPSDGRYAMVADRASCSSLTHWHWDTYKKEPKVWTKIMLNGLTNKDPQWLVELTKSWSNAPELKVKNEGFESNGYKPAEKAYQLKCKKAGQPTELILSIDATEESPLVNPAFIIENWGRKGIVMKTSDGKIVKPSKNFRVGHRKSAGGSDAIVWLAAEETTPVTITFVPEE